LVGAHAAKLDTGAPIYVELIWRGHSDGQLGSVMPQIGTDANGV